MQDIKYGLKGFFGEYYDEYRNMAEIIVYNTSWKDIENSMDRDVYEEVLADLEGWQCDNVTFLLLYIANSIEKNGKDPMQIWI